MNKVKISPKHSEVKPSGFYIYLHKKATNGTPFYVGKGKGHRGFVFSQRSKWWKDTAAKHGVIVEILFQGMSHRCALTMEKIQIEKYRSMGFKLVNMSDGGDGAVPAASLKRKKVYCSNGMTFKSVHAATRWVWENGNPKASATAISSCARGKSSVAYGHSWSYDTFPEKPKFTDVKEIVSSNSWKSNAKKVYCSNGMSFVSNAEASRWLKNNGHPKARDTHISNCARGKRAFAYGYNWSYVSVPVHPEITDPGQYRMAVRWGKITTSK